MLQEKKALIFSAFLIAAGIANLHAKVFTFPVHGLEVAAEEAVPTQAEWEENWLLESKPADYHHGIARIAALFSEISYVPVEKNPSSNELVASYRLLGFTDKNIECNYILDYTTPISGNNQAAYSFAVKDFKDSKHGEKLVFVILRGTPLNANEWISNVNVSDTTKKNVDVHEGFQKTSENIKFSLCDFLTKYDIKAENARFLIAGHSRGAALANILGAQLADENIIPAENMFVYTFAAPNVSQEDKTSDKSYSFIWNIVNAEDIVPTVPPNRNNWKWKKYGQTKVLTNYWNTDPETYLNNYLPRMNAYYKTFLLREYAPFKIGPFIHIQVARILTAVYKTVESYYRTFFGLRNMSEQIFKKIFPEEEAEKEEENQEESASFFLRFIQRIVNQNIKNGFEYAMDAFVDMHACESYLAWMLALDESEAFSELGSFQIVIQESYDCAVYSEEGNLLCRVLDGSVELSSLKIPISACPLPNKTVIGFPKNQNVNVVIHKDSLIPTVVPYNVEHYDAAGILTKESERHYFFPHSGTVLHFNSGSIGDDTEKIEVSHKKRKEAAKISKEYGLKQSDSFKVYGEFSATSDSIFSGGGVFGTGDFYGTVSGEFFKKKGSSMHGFSLGAGHQTTIYGRFLMDIEGREHFLWLKDGSSSSTFATVPSGRLTLSYKPIHRLQFFAGMTFDFHISDFNDEAFADTLRKDYIPSINFTDNLEAFPSLVFGIRF